MGKLKEHCHDDHTDRHALVTHEKESIVTEDIGRKVTRPKIEPRLAPTLTLLRERTNQSKP